LKITGTAMAHPGVGIGDGFSRRERVETSILVGIQTAFESSNDIAIGVFDLENKGSVLSSSWE
jgi:hypothetical protein